MPDLFRKMESNVRSYCRVFSDVFDRAKGASLFSESGEEYIDFFAGAGALNYGHNNDYLKEKMLSYIMEDGVIHALDMYTKAKRDFIQNFSDYVLKPRKLNYKLQFCGPTGTNAVEAALKLARKVKKRTGVFSFMGGFHGMSLGSLAVTSNAESRAGAGMDLHNVTFIPYPNGGVLGEFDSIGYIESILEDTHSGIEKPAAIILETIQAEGGINVAPVEFIQKLRILCNEYDILLICDDIQVGCGRTGPFFSFERANIVPDIIVLSKSLSGYGVPLSLLLIKPELDIWEPGEHNGTFRGNQIAFIAGAAALEYREVIKLEETVKAHEAFIIKFLEEEIKPLSNLIQTRGIGMIWGIDVSRLGGPDAAKKIVTRCFELGLIIERAGRGDTVVKIMPPLVIGSDKLEKGCNIIKQSIKDYLKMCESYSMSLDLAVGSTLEQL